MNGKNIAVIGAGVIGAGTAALFAIAGYSIRIYDQDPSKKKFIDTVFNNAREAILNTGGSADNEKPIKYTDSLNAALTDVNFIIEALPENSNLKVDMFLKIEGMISDDVLIISTSSGLLPSNLQEKMNHPHRLLVAHPCNPPYLMPVVELVPGKLTSAEMIDKAENLFLSIGKKVIRLKGEIPGHLINRLQAALWREAVYLVSEGYASVSDVDRAVTEGLGARWTVCGPHKIFHLAGGPDGLQGFLNRLGPEVERWWETLGNPVLDSNTCQILVKSMEEETQEKTFEDEVKHRDEQIARVLNFLS